MKNLSPNSLISLLLLPFTLSLFSPLPPPLQRGGQRMSYIGMFLLSLMWLTIFITLFVAVGNKLSWLNYLYVLSYIKLAVTLIKYVPQVS